MNSCAASSSCWLENEERRRPFNVTSALGFHASGAILGVGSGLWKGLPMNQLPKRMAGGVTIVFGLYILQASAFRNVWQHHFATKKEEGMLALKADNAKDHMEFAVSNTQDATKKPKENSRMLVTSGSVVAPAKTFLQQRHQQEHQQKENRRIQRPQQGCILHSFNDPILKCTYSNSLRVEGLYFQRRPSWLSTYM
mmetsp:Transcript_15144/g.25107  ORF Transcript_15144/g.25107 Transcript_15144/m.25107 type:complete len:196 (-) Transcript_15144:935-1522(-)